MQPPEMENIYSEEKSPLSRRVSTCTCLLLTCSFHILQRLHYFIHSQVYADSGEVDEFIPLRDTASTAASEMVIQLHVCAVCDCHITIPYYYSAVQIFTNNNGIHKYCLVWPTAYWPQNYFNVHVYFCYSTLIKGTCHP